MMKKLYLFVLLIFPFLAFAQNYVSYEIQENINAGKSFNSVSIFSDINYDLTEASIDRGVLQKGLTAKIDMNTFRGLWAEKPTYLTLDLPTPDGAVIQVLLMRHNIFTEEFVLRDSKTGMPIPYESGLHYKGIVDGSESSIAAISIYPNEIMGIVSERNHNYVIGKQADKSRHVIYDDHDLLVKNPASCETADDDYEYTDKELNFQQNTKDVGDCIRLYIEIDNDIVNGKGGATQATNYVTGLFNQSIVLYNNDQLGMVINEIFAWTTTSPYSSTSSQGMLSDFQANTGAINGDLGHLVSYQASGGIAAGFSGICNSNPDNSKCFSNIYSTYSDVPTYSWSVMVVTHEMGHLIGSRHTHACVWNGNNTAIDGCSGQTEGTCALPGNPAGGGTIMSYCHLQSVGINLNLGFGTQPGNVVRSTVANASCLSPCGAGCFDGIQNGDETGVDCGGPDCPACPTCDDGVQNGDEEGVDCGGSNCPACPAVYCGSAGTDTNYEWIQSIAVGTFSNNSGNNGGYADFTSQTANVDAGSSYSVTLDPGFSSTLYNEFWSIWIDLNGDVDFDDPGELVFQGNGNGTVTGNLTIPSSAALGNTRMRIAMKWDAYSTVCEIFPYGEVEDYTVAIGGGAGPTCDDGIQNGDETGVDCGGSNCPACPTCNDGIQNGDETGVDCGGPDCPACPTCNDGIQNGDETGVDCGGPDCPACPTCDDGIQNGDETGVDCGGPDCPACPTCNDGIQNGDETGVDCGGSCPPCNGGGCTYGIVDSEDFESGWGIWNDGGSDSRRASQDQAYANSGIYCIRLRDNTSSSTMTTDNINLSNADEVTVDFTYIARSMDNSNEDFWLQVSSNGGSSYTTVEEWNLNDEFVNNVREFDSVIIPGPFSSNTRFRFRCDASGNSDWVYIDDVTISACTTGALTEDDGITSLGEKPENEEVEKIVNEDTFIKNVKVYPVPTHDELIVSFDNVLTEKTQISVVNMYGSVLYTKEFTPESGNHREQIITSDYRSGIYFVVLTQNNTRVTKRFVVMN